MFLPIHTPQQLGLDKCFVPIAQGQLLCADGENFKPLPGSVWRFLNPQPEAALHYLGRYYEQDCYAVLLQQQPAIEGHSWYNLGQLLGALGPIEYEVAARGLQIVHWDREHRFCGRCGHATSKHKQDLAKHCSRCDVLYYPRLSPCVITVITRGEECLLAHNAAFAGRFFSALAGFVEAGETLESALRREVKEEVDVTVGALEYFGSQAWPFPSQLMIGFLAEYESGEIRVDGVEIDEAQWYRYDNLPAVPSEDTLSGQLIREFVRRNEAR
jgi:NAD+ diphosphatase